jgi:hypothetical protein
MKLSKILAPTQADMALYGKKTRADALLTKEVGALPYAKTLEMRRRNDFIKAFGDSDATDEAEKTRQVEFIASVANYFNPTEFSTFVMDERNPKHKALIMFYVDHFMYKEIQKDRLNPEDGTEIYINHKQAYKTMCEHYKVDPNEMNGAWQSLYTFFKSRGISYYYTREEFFGDNRTSSEGWNKLIETT